MIVMAKRKKPDEPPLDRKKPARSGVNINVWIDPDIHDALESYVSNHEPKTTITAVVQLAIKRYLRDVRKTEGQP